MTEEKRPDETVTPAETESPVSESVTVAPTPEVAETTTETHTMAEIDEENLQEPDRVQPMESVPPLDQKSDVPAEVEELREASKRSRPPVVDNEKRYGPLSGSMWFLALSVVTFILSLIFAIVA
jgi:hypothetical protein